MMPKAWVLGYLGSLRVGRGNGEKALSIWARAVMQKTLEIVESKDGWTESRS